MIQALGGGVGGACAKLRAWAERPARWFVVTNGVVIEAIIVLTPVEWP